MQNDGSVSAVSQFFRNKWVKTILILDALAIIAVIAVIIWNSTKTATINFNVAPLDAQIQIDGSGDYRNGAYQVHPGNHQITISRDGLVTKTFDLELKSDYDTTLTAFLAGEDNDFDFYTLRDNYDSFQKLAEIASEDNNLTTDQDPSAYEFIQNYQAAYDLWQAELPITQKEYTIEDGKDALVYEITLRRYHSCEKYLCIQAMMLLTDDKNKVTNMLLEKGFKLKDYEIEYKIY